MFDHPTVVFLIVLIGQLSLEQHALMHGRDVFLGTSIGVDPQDLAINLPSIGKLSLERL